MKTDEELQQESYYVAQAMTIYGGAFAENLGKALQCADRNNMRKIYETWTDMWEQYFNMSKHIQGV